MINKNSPFGDSALALSLPHKNMTLGTQSCPLQPCFFPQSFSSYEPSKPLIHCLPLSQHPNTPVSDPGLLFQEKVLYLEQLNVNPHRALHRNPNFSSAPFSTLHSVEHCLASFGIPRHALGRILDMLPQLLTADPISDLYPLLNFLVHEVGIPSSDVPKSILGCPRLLVCSIPNQLRPTLQFMRKLGFVGSRAIDSQTTLLLASSVEGTLLPKLAYLHSLGMEPGEVVSMVLRVPRLLTYSTPNNYMPKVEYFLEEMKGNVAELKVFPQYFCFSLENKIKPRHRLLVKHRFSLPLPKMLLVSDGEFTNNLIEMRLGPINGRQL